MVPSQWLYPCDMIPRENHKLTLRVPPQSQRLSTMARKLSTFFYQFEKFQCKIWSVRVFNFPSFFLKKWCRKNLLSQLIKIGNWKKLGNIKRKMDFHMQVTRWNISLKKIASAGKNIKYLHTPHGWFSYRFLNIYLDDVPILIWHSRISLVHNKRLSAAYTRAER